ncbi:MULTISPECIES: hypothetical protein [Streptomyces]|nr:MULTISPECIES: hypothetical protein [Streptomyces]
MTDHGADLLIRAGAVHSLVPGRLADLTIWDQDPGEALRDL